jgi:Transposase, Mutator family
VRIVWRGGAVTNLEVKRRVDAVGKLTRGLEMRDRALTLARGGMYDDQITAVLTNEGHRSPNSEEKVLLMAGSKEDVETVRAFFQDLRARGLGDPLLVVSDGAPGIIRAIEESFPRSERQRCLAHRMRNLAAKVPTDLWPEFKARVTACYQAPSRAIARQLAAGIRTYYADLLPSALACFEDDLEARITHLPPPVTHRRFVRTTNLLERLFVEERRRLKIIPTASARSRCSSSCSARSSEPLSAGMLCASPSSNCVRSPPSERTSTTNISDLNPAAGPVIPAPCFQQNPSLDLPRLAWFLSL